MARKKILFLVLNSFFLVLHVNSCSNICDVSKDIEIYDLYYRDIKSLNDEYLKNQPFIAVSLGINCHIALILKFFNIRINSFPFDWNFTPFEALYGLIENNFVDILNREHLCIKHGGPGIYNKKYGFWFAHDFHKDLWHNNNFGVAVTDSDDELNHYQMVCEYYKRRIDRFNKIFTVGVPIYLFRRVINPNEANSLQILLKSRFPDSNFTLICIIDLDETTGNVHNNTPGIIYYDTKSNYSFFNGLDRCFDPDSKDMIGWKNLLVELGLIKI
jgi:hypothetical protein